MAIIGESLLVSLKANDRKRTLEAAIMDHVHCNGDDRRCVAVKDEIRSQRRRRPKTKIVCTLGLTSMSVGMIEKLMKAGMNVARFYFSHGSHEYHQETLENLRTAVCNTDIPFSVMLDNKVQRLELDF